MHIHTRIMNSCTHTCTVISRNTLMGDELKELVSKCQLPKCQLWFLKHFMNSINSVATCFLLKTSLNVGLLFYSLQLIVPAFYAIVV